MSYDGSSNYKISARLKLSNRSISTKFFLITLFGIAIFSAGLYSSDAFRSKLYEIYYHTTSSVYGGVNSINLSLSSRADKVTNHFNLEEKYESLKAENQAFKDREIYYRSLASEITILKKAMKYSANDPKKILMTEILMQSSDGYVESARIPVGQINGVKKGDDDEEEEEEKLENAPSKQNSRRNLKRSGRRGGSNGDVDGGVGNQCACVGCVVM